MNERAENGTVGMIKENGLTGKPLLVMAVGLGILTAAGIGMLAYHHAAALEYTAPDGFCVERTNPVNGLFAGGPTPAIQCVEKVRFRDYPGIFTVRELATNETQTVVVTEGEEGYFRNGPAIPVPVVESAEVAK